MQAISVTNEDGNNRWCKKIPPLRFSWQQCSLFISSEGRPLMKSCSKIANFKLITQVDSDSWSDCSNSSVPNKLKEGKVAEDTVSVRNKILSTNLSRWGDAKSKAKVKKKFPENFGALYPGKNGPLGERILKVQHAFPHSKNQWLWSNNKCTAWFKR